MVLLEFQNMILRFLGFWLFCPIPVSELNERTNQPTNLSILIYFCRAPELEPHLHMQFSIKSSGGEVTLLQSIQLAYPKSCWYGV